MSVETSLLTVGNPLLDITVQADQPLFDKYNLKLGSTYLASKEHLPLYSELVKHEAVQYTAGGAGQNTTRAAQWMLKSKVQNATNYIGCVGNDDFGHKLKTAATNDGVNVHYMVTEKEPTGTCAVLVKDKERTLCANLGAANLYHISHFNREDIQKIVKQAHIYFCTGFFLTVSPETLLELGKHAVTTNKTFILNIAAPFLVEHFWGILNEIISYSDIVICNHHEAEAFGKKAVWNPQDLKDIATRLSRLPKSNTKRERTVIFTHGPNPTIIFHNGNVKEVEPVKCKTEDIVDVNGAGDSFAGGFVAGLILGKSLEESVKAGHYCAWEVIQRSGCTFPSTNKFQWT